jgi:hypothetical protein
MRKIKWNNIEFLREHGGPKTQRGPMAWNHAPGLKHINAGFLILNKKRANIANCGTIKTRPAAYLVKWNSKAWGNNYGLD